MDCEEGDTMASMQLESENKETHEFEKILVLEERGERSHTLKLIQGTWKVRYKGYDKFFIATENNPVTFTRIDS